MKTDEQYQAEAEAIATETADIIEERCIEYEDINQSNSTLKSIKKCLLEKIQLANLLKARDERDEWEKAAQARLEESLEAEKERDQLGKDRTELTLLRAVARAAKEPVQLEPDKNIAEYLSEQFPATRGNVLLRDWLGDLTNALTALKEKGIL